MGASHKKPKQEITNEVARKPSDGNLNKASQNGIHIRKKHHFRVPNYPEGIACDQEGNIYLAINRKKDDGNVCIYSKDGEKLSELTPGGKVFDLAVGQNRLYVTQKDTDNGLVYIYDNNQNEPVQTVTVGYKRRGGIAVTNAHMYVCSKEDNIVYRLDMPDGTNKQVFVAIDEGLDQPIFVACTDEHVAVSCMDGHEVRVYNTEGVCQFICGKYGTEPGQLKYPWGVALDECDRVLIADYYNRRISIVSPEGKHLKDIDLKKDGIEYPHSLAFNEVGQLLIACGGIQKPSAVLTYQY